MVGHPIPAGTYRPAITGRPCTPDHPIPAGTYRLQLGPQLTFRDALAWLPHIASLGLNWVYLSPIQATPPGATHGYAITEPNTINPVLEQDGVTFEHFARACKDNGLRILLDIVPNHLASGPHNPAWYDVMQRGQQSAYASWFDIDWQANERIVWPVLGAPLRDEITNGHIKVTPTHIELYTHIRLPLSTQTPPRLIQEAAGLTHAEEEAEQVSNAQVSTTRPPTVARPTASGMASERPWHEAPTEDITAMRAMAVHNVLEFQHYELCHWQTGEAKLNWRRFFTVASLAGVRVEDPPVFHATHAMIIALCRQGLVDGLRIDHIDGLVDPKGYLSTLQRMVPGTYIVVEKILEHDEIIPPTWKTAGDTGYQQGMRVGALLNGPNHTQAHQLFEQYCPTQTLHNLDAQLFGAKVIALGMFHGELARITALVANLLRVPLTEETYGEFGDIEHLPTLPDLAANSAANLANTPAANDEHGPRETNATVLPLSEEDITHVLTALCAGMPVYRTYAQPTNPGQPTSPVTLSPQDAAYLYQARANAIEHYAIQGEVVVHNEAFIEALDTVFTLVTGLPVPDGAPTASSPSASVMNPPTPTSHALDEPSPAATQQVGPADGQALLLLQQLSGPAMAKGFEDYLLYRVPAQPALCEVGTDTRMMQGTIERDELLTWLAQGPAMGLVTLSTHDTKRSEDIRARCMAIMQVLLHPEDEAQQRAQRALLATLELATTRTPEPTIAYLATLTVTAMFGLVTSHPGQLTERCTEAMIKSAREAQLCTSWTEPDEAAEAAIRALIPELIPGHPQATSLAHGVLAMADAITPLAQRLILTQVALRGFVPGVPDVYMGCEIVTDKLVDPDNRAMPVLSELTHARSAWDVFPDLYANGDIHARKTGWIVTLQALRERALLRTWGQGAASSLTTSPLTTSPMAASPVTAPIPANPALTIIPLEGPDADLGIALLTWVGQQAYVLLAWDARLGGRAPRDTLAHIPAPEAHPWRYATLVGTARRDRYPLVHGALPLEALPTLCLLELH